MGIPNSKIYANSRASPKTKEKQVQGDIFNTYKQQHGTRYYFKK